MNKNKSEAPKPDKRIGEAAVLQAKTGEEWLAFARDAFDVSQDRQAELDALTKRVTEQQLGIADEQAAWSRSDRERYETTFRPIEDQFIEEAANYGSPEKQAAAAAEAKADVEGAAAQQRQSSVRQAASLGLNPASGRFAGLDRGAEMGTALASAGAQNAARAGVRDKALALKGDVVNLGRGLPAQSAQAAALGLSGGSSAVGLNQGTNQQYIASTGIMGQGFSGAGAGYSGMANTLNQQYGNELNAWSAEQRMNAAGASGFGSFLGGVIGLGAKLIPSSKDIKTDKEPIPEGAALDAVESMPVEKWQYLPGEGDGGAHVGPYAEDFQHETGRGDGKAIPAQDAIGLTMRAVQDLGAKVARIEGAIGLGGAQPMPRKRAPSPMPAEQEMAA